MEWWRAQWDAVQTGNIQLDESRLRRWSILHELPYWKELDVHPESWMQVSDDGTETMPPAPWVLQARTEDLVPTPQQNSLPKLVCVLTFSLNLDTYDALSLIFYLHFLNKINFTGFGSYLRKAFPNLSKASWPSDLKSHDFHILLQHVLSTCLHGLGTQELREAILRP
ncbi:hypothetical protein R1sor_022257 [Riccia sorocarpa]|uniref:Uncharacterized protein n=1 Tax=Riccia sorocarpa TaxID=122646 RepID=A0ABD3GN54_9MARC